MLNVKSFTVLMSSLALSAGLSVHALQKVGDTLESRIETPHPVSAYWHQEIAVAGSSFLKVHLAKLDLGPDDELLVLDGDGQVVFSRKGPAPEGMWLPSVDGDTLTLEVWPASGSFPWGLLVDQVGHGYAGLQLNAPVPESICGTNDMQDAVCYASDAGKTGAGNTVGKMLFQEGGSWYLCTGSLVSQNNHFLTCNHCIADEAGAQSLQVSWKYQYSGCGSGSVGTDSTSNGAHLIKTDANLDYSLLQFASDTPAARYGYLTLNSSVPSVGSVLWIPQHPGGSPKKFAVNSDMDGGLAKVRAVGLDGVATGGHTDIGYYADTQGGSSGSPVLDASNTMIALHHYGLAGTTCQPSDMNQGVEMALIYPQIASYLTQGSFSVTASATPTSGPAPLSVTFSSTTSGGTAPFTYDWNFGDGTVHSTAQAPTHSYTSAGTYTVTLTAHDAASLTATDSHLSISVAAGMTAQASASTTTGLAPLAVTFSAAASGGTPPYTYDWAFGDGTAHSSAQAPAHTYTSPGAYTVTLTVHDSGGLTAVDGHLVITANGPLAAVASASPISGPAPLAVTFSAVASGGVPPYTYAWAFGDGATSTAQNPSHTYAAAGSYTAVLTVHDAASATAADTHLTITVTTLLVAQASASVTSGNVPLTVTFTGWGTGGTGPYTYDWDFGDGSAHSQAQSPTHIYTSLGTFAVIFTVHDSASAVATNGNIHIHTITPPVIASVIKLADPFRLKITGSNFHPTCTVKVNGTAVPTTTWKGTTVVMAKQGGSLKALMPKGVTVQVTMTNNDDGGVSAAYAYTR